MDFVYSITKIGVPQASQRQLKFCRSAHFDSSVIFLKRKIWIVSSKASSFERFVRLHIIEPDRGCLSLRETCAMLMIWSVKMEYRWEMLVRLSDRCREGTSNL